MHTQCTKTMHTHCCKCELTVVNVFFTQIERGTKVHSCVAVALLVIDGLFTLLVREQLLVQ